MKLYAVSDLHGNLDGLDPCGADLVVIAGDVAPMKGWGVWHVNNQVKWINRMFAAWCEKCPRIEFVVIPGNHDLFAQRGDVPTKAVWPRNVHFVVDEVVEVKGLRIAGSPWIPPISGRWAFEARHEDDLANHFAWISEGVDILVTHTPPFVEGWNIDVSLQTQSPHFGSRALTETIKRVKPKLLFCGHIHTGDHHAPEVKMKNQQSNIVAIDINAVKSRMLQVRGQQVLLDRDVAALYGVETKEVNQAVKRNAERFYDGYIFTLTAEECSRSQIVTMNGKRGSNIKYLPHAFTEKGLYMLATVLRSSRAIQATHAIIETYAEVRAMKRELLALHTEPDAQKRKSMMQHFGEALTDIVMPDLTTAETESSMEINFLIGKLKHTMRRTRKAEEVATGKDVRVRLLEARIRELSAELSNLRAMRPLRPIEV